MTGIMSSMSCATDIMVKSCTQSRVGTAIIRKAVTGCGNANGLSQEQCPVATGLVTRPTMMNHSFSTVLQTTSGVNSVHSNKKEDRIWNFYCCRATGYCTKQCYWTNHINNWDGYMNYRAPHPWVFTGAYSYHSNKKE